MAPALPAEVSGGMSVAMHESPDHGLGKKDDMEKTLARAAQEQGAAVIDKTANDTSTTDTASQNAIALPPMREQLLKACERGFAGAYSSEDPMRRDALELADRVVSDLIRELISPTAALYVPPDDFARMHRELRDLVESFAREMLGLASHHCKKLPVSEASLRSKIGRDFRDPQFRHKHRELFGYLEAARTAQRTPEALQRSIASGGSTAS